MRATRHDDTRALRASRPETHRAWRDPRTRSETTRTRRTRRRTSTPTAQMGSSRDTEEWRATDGIMGESVSVP